MKRIIIRFNAPVVLTLALLSLLALFLDGLTAGRTTWLFFSVYRAPLTDPLTYVRFFGHILGHSGWEHYMSNMLLLLLVGPGVEEKYGHARIFWCIMATALVTGLIQFIFFPKTALLGASGGHHLQALPGHGLGLAVRPKGGGGKKYAQHGATSVCGHPG